MTDNAPITNIYNNNGSFFALYKSYELIEEKKRAEAKKIQSTKSKRESLYNFKDSFKEQLENQKRKLKAIYSDNTQSTLTNNTQSTLTNSNNKLHDTHTNDTKNLLESLTDGGSNKKRKI